MNSRYKAHIALPNFGKTAQNAVAESHVVIVGIGGLGCPAAITLAGAGIGKLTLIDGDVVSESNLHRQPLFGVNDVGQSKVEIAARELLKKYDQLNLQSFDTFLTSKNVTALIKGADVVLDCTDNQIARYALDDFCKLLSTPLIYCGIHQYKAQLSVFHFNNGNSYRGVFPEKDVLTNNSCSETGVLNTLTAILGNMQANEAIKIITGIGEVIEGKMLVYDALSNSMEFYSFDPDYDMKITVKPEKRISEEDKVVSINQLIEQRKEFYLIDLSEENSYRQDKKLLPDAYCSLHDLHDFLSSLKTPKKIVFHCERGLKSRTAQSYAIKKFDRISAYRVSNSLKNDVQATQKVKNK